MAMNSEPIAIQGSNSFVQASKIVLGEDIFVSINDVSQAFGMKNRYHPDKKIATLKSNQYHISFLLNSKTISFNGNTAYMQAPTRLVKGQIMLPAHFAQEQIKELMKVYGYKPQRNASNKFVVVIDPGHGGNDMGTTSSSGIEEKHITLKVSKYLQNELTKLGYQVYLTRSTDDFITLWRRVYLAQKYRADLFISIHANSAENKKAHGIEVFYYANPTPSQNGKNYRKNLQLNTYLAKLMSQHLSSSLDANNRGAKNAKYFVIRNAHTPAILLEMGFLSNPKEAKKLNDPAYQQKIAKTLANAILFYQMKIER